MPESPHHDRPMQGIFMVSTASTAMGFIFENELPTISAYTGYKTLSGEFVYDETFNNYPIFAVEDKGDLIAAGNWSTRYAPWLKMGYNPDVNNTEEALNFIGGNPVWASSTGGKFAVWSASANDKAGLTGCSSVIIKYLDTSYLERTTTIILNGQTTVSCVAVDMIRVNNFQAYTGNIPAGNITIATSTNGLISQIGLGLTRARNSMYTVPSSKTLFIKSQYYASALSGTAKVVRILLKTNYNENFGFYSTSLFWPVGAALLKDNVQFALLPTPIKVIEKTDIYVSSYTTTASGAQQSESVLRGWTVEND